MHQILNRHNSRLGLGLAWDYEDRYGTRIFGNLNFSNPNTSA